MYAEDFNTPAAAAQPPKRRRTDDDERVSDEDIHAASLLVRLSQRGGGPSSSAAATTAGEVQKQKEYPSPSTAADFKKQTEYSPSTDHPPHAQNNCYRCDVCGKAFSSYQALGGHKTSHRDKPAAAAASHKRENATVEDYRPDQIPGGRLHKCAVCGKNFPTGQSLGGHKRKHYQGVIGIRSNGGARIGGNTSEIDCGGSSGVTSSSVGGASSQSSDGDAARFRWNFELNLPPPVVDLELRLSLS